MKPKQRTDILLVLNGELRSDTRVRRLARRVKTVICADGGARHAARLGLIPYVVIGDMDSLPKRLPYWKSTMYVCDFDVSLSDFEKALRFIARLRFRRAAKRILGAVKNAVPSVWVAGALGGRVDHEIVNWALLERYSEFMSLRLADDDACILGKGRHAIEGGKGRTVTLLAVMPGTRLTTHGLLYPLRKAILERSSLGLSNKIVSSKPRIDVHSGRVWVLRP